MKVYALKYLVEGDKNYKPGDEIKGGQLFTDAAH